MYIQLLFFFSEANLLYRVQYFSINKSRNESHWRTLWIDTVSKNPFTLDHGYKLFAKSPPQVTITMQLHSCMDITFISS